MNDDNCSWLRSHDFFMGNNGTFAVVREVSQTSHDIMMGDTVSSDASAMDVDSFGSPNDDGSAQPSTLEETGAAAQPGESLESIGLSGSSASAPRTLLGAEAPPGLLAIEDVKKDEYYQASDQVRGALQNLPEQIQQNEESQLANWVHTTENYPDNLWMDCEYARKACDRTGARIIFVIRSLEFGPDHPHSKPWNKVAIHNLLPYLDDYIMNAHDPFVEDFIWSMDDNRHTESKSSEFTEGDVPDLLLFADKEVINTVSTTVASSVAQAAGRDPSDARTFAEVEVKRHRQGLKRDEMGSSDVLDVTVFNLGNLARQSIRRQAEPKMLRLIMNQTSHIMMLAEGTSLSVNQWDRKLKEANWTPGSSDDRHH